jgi:hypothetical protein
VQAWSAAAAAAAAATTAGTAGTAAAHALVLTATPAAILQLYCLSTTDAKQLVQLALCNQHFFRSLAVC